MPFMFEQAMSNVLKGIMLTIDIVNLCKME